MELVAFGRTELRVAPICLGAMNFGAPGWGCDEHAAAEIVGVYRDAGGNFFDLSKPAPSFTATTIDTFRVVWPDGVPAGFDRKHKGDDD